MNEQITEAMLFELLGRLHAALAVVRAQRDEALQQVERYRQTLDQMTVQAIEEAEAMPVKEIAPKRETVG